MDAHSCQSGILQAQNVPLETGKIQKIITGFRPVGVGWFGAE
jgi:hypothetical protein